MIRVAICAPSTPLKAESIARVAQLARDEFPEIELHFHPQCEVSEGHFAGSDAQRLDALVFATDSPAFQSIYVAGECVMEQGVHRDEARIAGRFESAMAELWAAEDQ